MNRNESRASLGARIAALLAGLAILLMATLVSLGLALLAPFGIWVTHRIQRARGRTLGLWDSWIVAVSTTIVVMLIISGGVASRVSSDTWRGIRHAADSASAQAAKEPPPAWLSRLAPGAGRQRPLNATQSTTFNGIAMVWGLAMGVGVLGTFVGTAGWVSTMLLVFYAAGHWLRRPPTAEIDPDLV